MVKGSFGNTPRKRLADISNFQEKKSKPTTQVEKPLTIPPTTKEYIEHLHQVLLHWFQLFCFWSYCVLHVKWLLYLIWFFGFCDPGKYGIGKASCRPKVSFTLHVGMKVSWFFIVYIDFVIQFLEVFFGWIFLIKLSVKSLKWLELSCRNCESVCRNFSNRTCSLHKQTARCWRSVSPTHFQNPGVHFVLSVY